MKPEWLRCETCLWWDNDIDSLEEVYRNQEAGVCRFISITQKNNPDMYCIKNNFCSNWTCANCWKSWDNEILNLTIDEDVYIDHSKCTEVRFK